MPTVKLRFPGGRYHATPWGHHVNEGLVEWPPSPWRLLRAFIACGFTSQGWTEIPPAARRLIDKLAAVLPLYRLPSVSAAHSRHFMPVGVLSKGREQTTLVFDTWANVGKSELFVQWPCELANDESELFGRLVASLGYLGRSESWVDAELTEEAIVDWTAVPCQSGEHRGLGWEQVSLMAAIVPHEYQIWRDQTITPILTTIDKPTSKKVNKKQQEKYESQCRLAQSPFPPDILECLTKDTVWWKGHGWSQPPGSQRVLYWRRTDALQVGVPTVPRYHRLKPVQFMLLALTTPTGNSASLDPVIRTLPCAEIFHQTIIANAARGKKIDCPELIGKDQFGKPLRDQHRHAHVIPLALNDLGRIDHILVYCESGLGDKAQEGIRRSRETWRKNGPEIQVSLVASGSIEDLQRLPSRISRYLGEYLGPPQGASMWESATPFVLPRFLKGKGKDTLEGQVQAELISRNLPLAQHVKVDTDLTKALRHFVRCRNRGGVPPKVDAGYGLRIFFPKPVFGPLLLGYASHYGLGQFRAPKE